MKLWEHSICIFDTPSCVSLKTEEPVPMHCGTHYSQPGIGLSGKSASPGGLSGLISWSCSGIQKMSQPWLRS